MRPCFCAPSTSVASPGGTAWVAISGGLQQRLLSHAGAHLAISSFEVHPLAVAISPFHLLLHCVQYVIHLRRRPRRASMEILIPADRIQQRVAALAREIAGDYQEQHLTIVGVLTGCLMFLADLVRHLDLPLRIGLLQASSYRGNATMPGKLYVQPELIPDVRGRHVLLVDDILDTGQTLGYVMDHLHSLGPQSLRVAVRLRKIGRQKVPQ